MFLEIQRLLRRATARSHEGSEIKPKTQLQLSRSGREGSDLTEGWIAHIHVWNTVIHHIEHIECLGPELKVHSFPDSYRLSQGEVGLKDGCAPEYVSAQISVRELRNTEGRRIDPLVSRWHRYQSISTRYRQRVASVPV